LPSAGGGVRSGEVESVVAELQRLRYGRRETWAEPKGVFRRARQVAKEFRQVVG